MGFFDFLFSPVFWILLVVGFGWPWMLRNLIPKKFRVGLLDFQSEKLIKKIIQRQEDVIQNDQKKVEEYKLEKDEFYKSMAKDYGNSVSEDYESVRRINETYSAFCYLRGYFVNNDQMRFEISNAFNRYCVLWDKMSYDNLELSKDGLYADILNFQEVSGRNDEVVSLFEKFIKWKKLLEADRKPFSAPDRKSLSAHNRKSASEQIKPSNK